MDQEINDKPNPNEPTKRSIAIPTIGKTYMYFAIFSIVAFDDGSIVKEEKTRTNFFKHDPPSN